MEGTENPTPIVFDPEILDIMNSPGPSLSDFEEMDHPERVWSDRADPRTIDDLIEVLEGYRDRLGGDAEVRSFEGGHHIHVNAVEYDDESSEVRL